MTEDLPIRDKPPVTASDDAAHAGSAVGVTEPLDEQRDTGSSEEEHGDRRTRRRAHRRRNTIEWIVVLVGALVIALLIKTFLFQAFYIPSDSMEPTLKVGDRVLVNKLSYRMHDVHRGDIVVFDRPTGSGQTVEGCNGEQVTIPTVGVPRDEVHDLIKRVVATEGETVEQRDGTIHVNGQPLDEPYVHKTNGVTDRTPAFKFASQCIKVPDGKVFVLGDNRTDSNASNMFGPINESTIVGRAFVRVWPLGDLGGV